MRLLNLPTEIIINILVAAAYFRGLKRALRLRLVCQKFNTLFYDALFATNLLDEYASSGSLDHISRFALENQAPKSYFLLWQSYLSLRIQSPNRTLTNRMSIIKQTAGSFCSATGLSGENAVQECIWKLSDIRIHESHQALFQNPATPLKFELRLDMQRALLVAAGRMNNVPLAQIILEECAAKDYIARRIMLFGKHNGFKCPAYIAARYASNEVLDLFLQQKRHFKVPRGVWQGCGLGGTRETLDVILKNWPADGLRSQAHRYHNIGNPPPFFGLYVSSNPEFFKTVRSLWQDSDGGGTFDPVIASVTKRGYGEIILAAYASWGYGEMVEHLIKLEIPINASAHPYEECQPLQTASRGFHPDIVKLLLEHGADPNQCDALVQGTMRGSLEVVRILLNSGAKVDESAERLVKLSVRLEHTSMFNLLRDYGALTREAWETGLKEALKEGLDSMVTLLQASDYGRAV